MLLTKTPEVSCRPIKPGAEVGIVDLVSKVFTQFVAPEYTQEGITEFMKLIRVDGLTNRIRAGHPLLVAESGQNITGVVEVRENSHVAFSLFKIPAKEKESVKNL